jgi:single-strand DNA-binding protein
MIQLLVAGNLGGDARVNTVSSEREAINFSVPHSYKYKKGNETIEKTTWVECTMFVKIGKTKIAEHLKKGKGVSVIGVPEARAYQQGEEIRSSLTMIVDSLELL